MEKKLLTCGIVLLILAAVCLGASALFHYMHHSVLDGSAKLYARLWRRYLVSLFLGIGFAVTGVLLILARLFIKK